MIILYIVIGIVPALLLILSLPVTLDIRARGEELKIRVRVLGIYYTLYPRRERPVKLSRWRIKSYRKRRLKEQRKYLKKKLLEDAENERIRKFLEEHPELAEKTKATAAEKMKATAEYVTDIIKNAVVKALECFGEGLTVRLYYFRVTVGGDDPDKTALTYGFICQSVAYLNEILKNHLNMRYPGRVDRRLYVGVDFLSPKTEIEARISLSVRLWRLIKTLAIGGIGYVNTEKPQILKGSK